MARNAGSTVDVVGQRVLDRDGLWYPLDRVAVANGGLSYARPVSGNDHFHYHERWLLPEQTWSVSRFTFHESFRNRVDWYIEMDSVEVTDHAWRVRDGYLDVAVFEGVRYEVWDADELAKGLRDGEITLEEAMSALEALNRLTRWLSRNKYSGTLLLDEFARGLPR